MKKNDYLSTSTRIKTNIDMLLHVVFKRQAYGELLGTCLFWLRELQGIKRKFNDQSGSSCELGVVYNKCNNARREMG